jgi:methylated-DNA-[protein]-cysteine S-methyltransferase
MDVFTSYYSSPLGMLRLQCAADRLMSVVFTDEAPAFANEHPVLKECALQLDGYFAGTLKSFHLPLGQPGTGFQQKIWELLETIPFGKTISYQHLSKQYGDPKAIRAIASANGRNNLAIIIPCHRVIGSDRSLTGYAGGLWRKRWLLDHEAKHHSGVRELAF